MLHKLHSDAIHFEHLNETPQIVSLRKLEWSSQQVKSRDHCSGPLGGRRVSHIKKL